MCALQYPCPPPVSSNPGFYGKGLKKWVRPAGGADRNQTRKISGNSRQFVPGRQGYCASGFRILRCDARKTPGILAKEDDNVCFCRPASDRPASDRRALDQAVRPRGLGRRRDWRRRAAVKARRGADSRRVRRPLLRARLLSPVLLPAAGRLSCLRMGLALDAAALEPLGPLGFRRLPPELVIRHRPGRVSSPPTQLANTRISAGSNATMSAR